MAKQFLDKAGVELLWNKAKSSFAKIGYLGSNANFNNVTDGGMYRYDTNPSNAPSGGGTHGQLLVVRGTGDTIAQFCFPYSSSKVYLRTGNPVGNSSGVWNGWVELANTSSLTWDSIQNKPSSFTPSSHTHTKSQITDFPTIPTVNNPTITITQGGVSKGSFTLNQSSSKTIALDGGGSSSPTLVWSGSSQEVSVSLDADSLYLIRVSDTYFSIIHDFVISTNGTPLLGFAYGKAGSSYINLITFRLNITNSKISIQDDTGSRLSSSGVSINSTNVNITKIFKL